MAQLRDAVTSEILHEGTPLEVAQLAEKLGPDEVLFDGVGLGFDPAAVLRAQEEHVAGLQGAQADAEDADERKLLKEHYEAAVEAGTLDRATVTAARNAMKTARARVK